MPKSKTESPSPKQRVAIHGEVETIFQEAGKSFSAEGCLRQLLLHVIMFQLNVYK